MAMTKAQQNRAIRQEALREQLAGKGLIQKVLENIAKMEELDSSDTQTGTFELQKLKTSNDQRLKLINKYLPDLKMAEITGEGGGPVQISQIERKVVSPKA